MKGVDERMKLFKKKVKVEEQNLTMKEEVIDFAKTFAKFAAVALIVRSFVFNVAQVEGRSMQPTLSEGDRVIVWQLFYTPNLFDVVVLEHTDGVYHVKRVLGTPGDHVDYVSGQLFINGNLIEEPYLYEDFSQTGFIFEQLCQFDDCHVIPENYFLVLGDNRNVSGDSRRYGLVHRSQIVGRSVLRISPFSKFGIFD